MTVNGIDVSNHQGRFNWGACKDKISFGMAKATEGIGFTDAYFGANWDDMWAMNPAHTFPRFAYSFFHAGQDPDAQAEHLVSVVKSHGLLPGDNFVLDCEATEGGKNDGLTPAQVAPKAVQCLRKINALAPGHRVLPYMNTSWADAGGGAGMESWFLWLASYQVKQPRVPAPWTAWTFWQNSDNPIDFDVYAGTQAQLLEFCRMPKSR